MEGLTLLDYEKAEAICSGFPYFTPRWRLMVIPFPAALKELSLALEQRIQIGGLQPCSQPAALVVVQIVGIHQFISDMYEGYCPYLLPFGHTDHLPNSKYSATGKSYVRMGSQNIFFVPEKSTAIANQQYTGVILRVNAPVDIIQYFFAICKNVQILSFSIDFYNHIVTYLPPVSMVFPVFM